MARSYNKMTLIGNLGHDPDLRYLPDGTLVATFDVAVNERRHVGDRTVQSTQWFHVSCSGRLAETAAPYLHVGSSVYIEGPLRARDYVGQTGQKRIALDVRAREVQMLDQVPSDRNAAEATDGGDPTTAQTATIAGAQTASTPAEDLDKVPF